MTAMMVDVVWHIDSVHWWVSRFDLLPRVAKTARMRATVVLMMIGAERRPEFGIEEFPRRGRSCRMSPSWEQTYWFHVGNHRQECS
jgi:hypothetical protein